MKRKLMQLPLREEGMKALLFNTLSYLFRPYLYEFKDVCEFYQNINKIKEDIDLISINGLVVSHMENPTENSKKLIVSDSKSNLEFLIEPLSMRIGAAVLHDLSNLKERDTVNVRFLIYDVTKDGGYSACLVSAIKQDEYDLSKIKNLSKIKTAEDFLRKTGGLVK